MEKIINELVEMSNNKIAEKVLIAYSLRNELSIEHMYQVDYIPKEYQVDYIPKEYQVGVLNLEVYNNYEDIKEELNNMLNEGCNIWMKG